MSASVLEELVQTLSVSGQERVIAGYIAESCAFPGHTVTMVGDNVVVRIPGADPTKVFLVNGHTDTVPPTDEWQANPFALQPDPENSDHLIGLGASDMKAGIAIMVEMAMEAARCRPPCDVWLLFSSSEETDSSGSIQLTNWLAYEQGIEDRYKTIGGLILEPTNADFVGIGHRGDTIWNVTAQAAGGHASQEFATETAIEKISRFIAALPQVRATWSEQYTDDVLRRPSINPTVFKAGTTMNVVPPQAHASLNIRATPQLAQDLPEIRAKLEEEYGITLDQSWAPTPTICKPDEHIYRVASAVLPTTPFQAFPGVTDQFAFHNHHIPMLIYGPGDPNAMHQPDEWVSKDAIRRCKRIVRLILQHF